MAKVFYEDAFGNKIEVDDEVSLLGPNPPVSPESNFDSRYVPIRFHTYDVPAKTHKEPSGYSNPVDDPEYIAKHWPAKETV